MRKKIDYTIINKFGVSDDETKIMGENIKYADKVHKATFVKPPNPTPLKKVDFNNVKIISPFCFSSSDIEKISLKKVNIIGMDAFAHNYIKEVTIPKYVYKIDSSAFKNNKIEKLELNSELLESISYSCFECNELKRVDLQYIKRIERDAFKDNQLEWVRFSRNLIEINARAFENNLLENINLPDSLKIISVDAFKNNKLTKVVLPKDVSYVSPTAFDEEVELVHMGKPVKNFDDILTRIDSTKTIGDIKVYFGDNLSFGWVNRQKNVFIAEKDGVYAHGSTIKDAIRDLEYKLEKRVEFEQTIIDVKKSGKINRKEFRIITGACNFGIDSFIQQNKLDGSKSIEVKKLLPLLRNRYGYNKIKECFPELYN